MRASCITLTCVAALAMVLALAGCAPAPPREAPSISGTITIVTPGEGNLGNVLVEGPSGAGVAYDRASVNITSSTTVLRVTPKGYERIMFSDLRSGMKVHVWFTGAVAESYPVQATAKALVAVE
ncbi:MAG: YobA family protein [Actinomycetia bacterium]|nr:YobA family protein [Actinomycetes bacterium]